MQQFIDVGGDQSLQMIVEKWLIVFKEWQPLYSSVWNVSSRVLGEIVLNFPLKEPQAWRLIAVMLELFLTNDGVTLADLVNVHLANTSAEVLK